MKKQRSPAHAAPRSPASVPGRKNSRLSVQRRKVLGAHYAAKYRVGKR